jgi:filamentous hemagglutinin family protein
MGLGKAFAQPVGASVVAGQAQVLSSGATTFINQATSKAIINWQDFSVSAGAAVQFNQPNAASITLNRVTGSNISTIDGAIRANGQVWLLNPNGLLFGGGATINVGGLLATTSEIANQDFIEGRYNFSSGRNTVVNNGTIKASTGGSVVLSAPNVVNNGLIQANAGQVVLGGTDTFTVDFNGDHLLSYAVGSNSAGGKVTNTGKIQAQGGRVLLTARAAAGVQDAVVNNSGMVEATSVREENGEIILEADGGGVSNSGTLDASGKGAGETGGTVKVLGQQVAVADVAKIDVSGDAGGGTALIGGNFHGAGPEQNAQNTTVGKATIKADAITSGNGGKVAIWSDGTTRFAGSISARGGARSGNGGQVETSGNTLSIDKAATVTTAATYGVAGNWLLDPDFITIDTCSSGCTTGNITYASNPGGTDDVDATTLGAALNSGNVTLQANLDITVNSPVTSSSTFSTTLTLDAGRSIILNANLTTSYSVNGQIVLFAGNPSAPGGSASGATISSSGGATLTGSFFGLANGTAGGAIGSLTNPINLFGTGSNSFIGLESNTNNGNLFVQSASPVTICGCSTLATSGVALGTGNFTLTAVSIADNAALAVNNATLTNTGSGDIALNGVTNAVTGTLRMSAPSGNINFTNGSTTTVLGSSSASGSITVTAGQTLQLTDTSGSVSANAVSLTAANFIDQAFFGAELPIVATNLTATTTNSTGSLRLLPPSGTGNAVTGTVTLTGGTAGGIGFSNSTTINLAAVGPVADMTITSSGVSSDININGTLQASDSFGITLNAGRNIAFGGGSGLVASTVSLTSSGGSIGSSGFGIPVSAASGAVSLSVSNTASGGSAYITSTSPVIVTSGSLSGGIFDLETTGATSDITVTGAISTFGNSSSIFLSSQGSLILNANVTDTDAPIFLDANSNFATNSAASITGTGTVSAGNVAIQLGGVNDTGTGSIGTSAGSPLLLNLATSGANTTLGLEVSTGGQNAFLGSQSPVSISSVDSTLGIQGVNLSGTTTFGNFTLAAAGQITEGGTGITAGNLTLSTTGIGNGIVLLSNNTTNTNGNGTAQFNTASGSDVFYTSGNNVTLGHSTVGGAMDIEATGGGQTITLNDSTGTVSVGGLLTLNSDGAISQTIPITAGSLIASASVTGDVTLNIAGNSIPGTVMLSSTGNVSFFNGGSTNLGTSSAGGTLGVQTGSNLTVAAGATVTAGGSVNFTSGGSTTLGSSSAVTAGTNPNVLGPVVFDAGGDITLGGSINTSGTAVSLDAGGSIFVNAPINSIFNGSGPGTIALTANDPQLGASTGNSGISGSGTLTAATISLQAGPGTNSQSGSIGMSGTPLLLQSDTGAVSLSVQTADGNVYLSSANPVSIDPGPLANGVNTFGSGTGFCCYGEFTLAAVGPITQTYGIQSGNLMLTSTGSNAAIALTDTGQQSDPGNSVFGTIHFTTTGSVAYSSGFSNNMGPILGASTIGGNLVVNSSNGDLSVQDPNGGTVNVGGTTQLVAGTGHGISINSPLVSTSGITILADQDISQNAGTSDVHIQTGGNLLVQSNSGGVFLTDVGCSGGSCGVADPGNQVGGIAIFNGATSVIFGASTSLTLGSITTGNGGKIKVVTGGDLTLANGAVLNSSQASGFSIQLVATGHFINNAGAGALVMPNGGSFAVFSSGPAGDVFGGLNSGNTAIWGTTFNSGNGPPPFNVTGNRYVFAQAATITVSASSASKVYGVNDTASLQSGYTITGLQPGVAGVYLADTAAITSGAPTITSTGAAATAGVGSYVIAPSAGSFTATNGYTVAFQNNTLTVTPATLAYVANAAARTYGAANPAFSGNVSGFVNGDTLVSATGGTLVFASPATAANPVGRYAINGSGLLAANYIFTQAASNATALTISPATLLYVANAATRAVSDANPAFSGNVTGLVNGDALTSATSGTLVFNTPANAASAAGSYAINGSGLLAVNYVFAQAPANATAFTITNSATTLDTQTVTDLTGFAASLQTTPLSPLLTTVLGDKQTALNAPPPLPPPPAPPPPQNNGPLADLAGPDGPAADTPNSSDSITSQLADSLDGGNPPPPSVNSGPVIPKMLTNGPPPPPPPTDISALPSFGNASLWQ